MSVIKHPGKLVILSGQDKRLLSRDLNKLERSESKPYTWGQCSRKREEQA